MNNDFIQKKDVYAFALKTPFNVNCKIIKNISFLLCTQAVTTTFYATKKVTGYA